MTYDDWKLAGPPEADEEQMLAECTEVDDDGVGCNFDSWVTAMIEGDKLTWTCPKCEAEYEESTRDRFEDG